MRITGEQEEWYTNHLSVELNPGPAAPVPQTKSLKRKEFTQKLIFFLGYT